MSCSVDVRFLISVLAHFANGCERRRRWQLRVVTTGVFAPSDPPHLMATAACWTKAVMLCRLFEGLVDGVAPSTALIPPHAIQAPCTSVSEFQPIHNWSLHSTPSREFCRGIPSHSRVPLVLAVLLWL